MKGIALKQEQFIVDTVGQRLGVILDVATYERLRQAEEDLECVRAYDEAKPKVMAEIQAGAFVSLEEYRKKRARKRT